MSDTKQVPAWEKVSQVDSFNLFGTSVRQNPCGVMDGAPTEDTVGVVGALIVDTSAESRKKDMWKCIAVFDKDSTIKEGDFDCTEENTGQLRKTAKYQWNKVGSSSTEIVTERPEHPDEDVDYIVNDNGVYLFYKWIKISDTEYQWTLIAGSVSKIVESKDVLDKMTGNTYTDYYVPSDGDTSSYFHYRWKPAEGTEGNDDYQKARFVMIGTDAYSKGETDSKISTINQTIQAEVKPQIEALKTSNEGITADVQNLKDASRNYEIYYEELPENTVGDVPPEGAPLDNLLFLLKEKDGQYESTGFVKITGGSGGNDQLADVKVTCNETTTQNLLKGTKEKWITLTAKVKQTPDALEEPATTYAWKNSKNEIIKQGKFDGLFSLDFNLIDLGLTESQSMNTITDIFTFYAYDALGIAFGKLNFTINQISFSIKINNPLNNNIYSIADTENIPLEYVVYGQQLERKIITKLNHTPIDEVSVNSSVPNGSIVSGKNSINISQLNLGANVLTSHAITTTFLDKNNEPIPTEKVSCLIFAKDNDTKILFGSTYDYNKNGNRVFEIEQYDVLEIPYYLSDQDNSSSLEVTLQTKTDVGLATEEIDEKTQLVTTGENIWYYLTDKIGEQELTISYKNEHFITIKLRVKEKNLGFTPNNKLLAFDFNPQLIETNATTWKDELHVKPAEEENYIPIELKVSSNFDWINGGFKEDQTGKYFKVCAGTTAEITYSNLFGTGISSEDVEDASDFSKYSPNARPYSVAKEGVNLKTIFKTMNVTKQESPFLKCTEDRTKNVKIPVGRNKDATELNWTIQEENKENLTYRIELAHKPFNGAGTATVEVVETNKRIEEVAYVYETIEKEESEKTLIINSYHFSKEGEIDFSIIEEVLEGVETVFLQEERSTEVGLTLTTSEVIFSHLADGGNSFTSPYSEEEIIELNFVIPPLLNNQNKNVILFYEDGVPSLISTYSSANYFNQNNKSNIIIGSPDCDVYIYRLKAHQQGFSSRDVLNEFIVDAKTPQELSERQKRNNCIAENYEKSPGYFEQYIIPSEAEESDVRALAQQYTNLRFILIEAPHVTTGKSEKQDMVKSNIECIYNGGRPEDNWRVKNGGHVGQGTTSNTYGFSARNINIHLNYYEDSKLEIKDAIGNWNEIKDKDKKKINLNKNSMFADVFNIKVNVASSEHSNNALLQKLYDKNLPYEPRSKTYYKLISNGEIEAKTTMEFEPCVIFIRETATSTDNRVFGDNYYHFYSLGNIGDAKVTDAIRTYGATSCKLTDEPEPTLEWNRVLDENEFVLEISDNHEPNATFQTGKTLTSDNLQDFINKGGTSGEEFLGRPFYPVTSEDFKNSSAYLSLIGDWGTSFEFRYIFDEDENSKIYTDAVKKWNEFYEFVITSEVNRFEEELKDWFIEEAALYFYLFTERFSMMDNRAKNTFWHWAKWYITEEEAALNHNWDKATATFVQDIFGEKIYKTQDGYIVNDIAANKNNGYRFDFWDYDNDSSIGINNMGAPTLPPATEDIDKDYTGTPHFNAAGSVFFRRLRDYVEYKTTTEKKVENGIPIEITVLSKNFQKAQQIINNIPKSDGDDGTIAIFDNWQKSFPEEFWRQDFERKYLRTYFDNDYNNTTLKGDPTSTYIGMYTGRKKYQRKYWEREQNNYFNSKYLFVSEDNAIIFRYNDNYKSNNPLPGLTIIPYSPLYGSLRLGNNAPQRSKRLKKGESFTFADIQKTGAGDTQSALYFLPRLQSVSGFAPYGLRQLDFKNPDKLSEAILGNVNAETNGIENTRHKITNGITYGGMPLVRNLNIENYPLETDANLADCTQLRNLKAQGTGLTTVTFPKNYLLQNVELPPTLTAINLSAQPQLIDEQNTDNPGFKILPKTSYRFASVTSFTESNTGLDELSMLLEEVDYTGKKLYQQLEVVNFSDFIWDIRGDETVSDVEMIAILEDFYRKRKEGKDIRLSGTIYINKIGTQEQKKYQDTWSGLIINATEIIQDYTVKYVYLNEDGNEQQIGSLVIPKGEFIPDIFIDEDSFSDAKDYIVGVYANQDWSNWGKDGGNWGTYAPEGIKINKTEIEKLLPKDPSNRFTYYIGHPDARNSALVDINSDGGAQNDDILYKESLINYTYLPYDGWKRKYANGAIVGIDSEQCKAIGDSDEITMVVNTIPITNRFTVTWYLDNTKEQSLHEETLVPYGTERVYDMNSTDKVQFIGSMGSHTVKTFKGWNRNTGYVTEDLEVWGLWDVGEFSKLIGADNTKIKPMKDMNPAEIYAIAINTNAAYSKVKFNDYEAVNITLGQDFDFDNVEQEVLVGPDGKIYNTDWTDDDDPENDCYKYYIVNTIVESYNPEKYVINLQNSFVFALDFKASTDFGTFLKLSVKNKEETIDFFKMYGSEGNSKIYYKLGDSGYKSAAAVKNRERLVFLYDHFAKEVQIFISNDASLTQYNIVESERFSIEDFLPTAGETGLTGDIVVSFSNSENIQTFIYDCKIWKENLGIENCRKLANWPRELIQMRYSSNNYTKDDVSYPRYQYKENEEPVDCHGYFICDGILSKTSPMNFSTATMSNNRIIKTSEVNAAGGWNGSKLRAFLNGGTITYKQIDQWYNVIAESYTENVPARVYNAFPENWRAIIKETYVPYSADTSGIVYESLNYIFLPSIFEYTYSNSTITNGTVYQDKGELLSWIPENSTLVQNYRHFSGKMQGGYRPKSQIDVEAQYYNYQGDITDVDITGKNIGDILQLKHNQYPGNWANSIAYMINFNNYRIKTTMNLTTWWTRTYSTGSNAGTGFATVSGLIHYGGATYPYNSSIGIVPCFTI